MKDVVSAVPDRALDRFSLECVYRLHGSMREVTSRLEHLLAIKLLHMIFFEAEVKGSK